MKDTYVARHKARLKEIEKARDKPPKGVRVNYRLPEPVAIRLKDFVDMLKKQDYTWSESKVVREAITFYLNYIREKQMEKLKHKGLLVKPKTQAEVLRDDNTRKNL